MPKTPLHLLDGYVPLLQDTLAGRITELYMHYEEKARFPGIQAKCT